MTLSAKLYMLVGVPAGQTLRVSVYRKMDLDGSMNILVSYKGFLSVAWGQER